MSVIQQALTPKVDALVEDAKAKFLAEFQEVADHAAFAPGNNNNLFRGWQCNTVCDVIPFFVKL